MIPNILDVCCGSRMFWFDRDNPSVVFCDSRQLDTTLCDGRKLRVAPDVVADFTKLPFKDNSFDLVVFDPPHLRSLGDKSWMAKKYGKLGIGWEEMIRGGFSECFRVLRGAGILIFKWNDTQIKLAEVISLAPQKPLFGNRSKNKNSTFWLCYMKGVSK